MQKVKFGRDKQSKNTKFEKLAAEGFLTASFLEGVNLPYEDMIIVTEFCHEFGISVTGYYSLIFNNYEHDQQQQL